MFEHFSKPSNVYARILTNDVLKEFDEHNIEYTKIKEFNNIIEIKLKGESIINLESFKKGHIYIQDINSLRAVEVLNPFEEDKILDCCAAPGGKTFYILSKTNTPKNITAIDNSSKRLLKFKENMNRLNIEGINIIEDDSTKLEFLKEKFDKILIDAPCSNLGVIGRKIDVKYRITKKDILYFSNLQLKILNSAYTVMKKGSILVYSTCTLAKEENELNISKFLSSKHDLKLIDSYLNLPGINIGDGGYIAKIKKE